MRSLVFTTALCLSAITLIAEEKNVAGQVTSVDPATSSISVAGLDLEVSRKSKIAVNGKSATLEDIVVGQQANVIYDDRLDIAISIVAGGDDGEAQAKEMMTIQGEWRCIAAEENGNPTQQSRLDQEARRVIVKGNSLTMQRAGASWVGKFEIDVATGHFDWIGKSVPQNGLVEWVGIYQLDGDTLKLCFIFNKEDKAERPTKFKSLPPAQPGLAHAFYTFKRSKD